MVNVLMGHGISAYRVGHFEWFNDVSWDPFNSNMDK